jgi:hypothetical protein
LACGFAAGCHFGVDALETDGATNDAATPVDGAADAGDAAVPDLATSDQARPRDFASLPDGVVRGGLGWPCSMANDCTGGLCVDGYCCDQLCDPTLPANLCMACNVPGFEGRCTLALAGTDPRGQCPPEATSTCGRDGTCDGAGACRLWVAGTACTAPSCAGGQITYPAACDGNGKCGAPQAAVSCAPFKCADAMSCGTSCTGNNQCTPGNQCKPNQTCGTRVLGQPCFFDADCASATCAQGVCCATACAGPCAACNTPGSYGTCAPIPAGGAPQGDCMAQTRESCGRDGTCDGAGACRSWIAGTPCAGPACGAGVALSGRACDGAGACAAATSTDCGGFACNASTATCFRAPCTSNAQCAQGNTCQSDGSCG